MPTSDETQPITATPSPTPTAPEPWYRRRNVLVGGGVAVGLALLVGAFFVGQGSGSTTQSGPTTLGAALTAARTGSLPCGTSNEVTARALARLCSGQAAGAGAGGANAAGGGQGGGGRGLMVGTVASVSGNQVTLQTGQGSVTLTIGTDAAVRTTTTGSAADLTTGVRVLVTGGAAGGTSGGATRQILVLGRAGGAQNGAAPGTTTPPSS